jgi:hypothetical protein
MGELLLMEADLLSFKLGATRKCWRRFAPAHLERTLR